VQKESAQLFRLNRAIAHTGLCSRRSADELILQGRVKVNGKKVDSLSRLIDLHTDVLEVDGRKLTGRKYDYVLLNKPKGVVTTCSDQKDRPSVLEFLPPALRHLKPAGRLDKDSQGLLILSNDGKFIQALTHPKGHVSKTYRVKVAGPLDEKILATLSDGIRLSHGVTSPAKVRVVSVKPGSFCLEIILSEGKNRQLRRMCGSLGLRVTNLIRVAIGELQLRGLPPGAWRRLSNAEVNRFRLIPPLSQAKTS